MRASMLILLFPAVLACAGGDEATTDTSAAVAAEAPDMLTPSDLSGTWTGTTMMQESDSVISRWTMMQVSDTSGRLVIGGTTDTVDFTSRYSGDSVVATSEPYSPPSLPRGTSVTFRSTGRMEGDKLVGTVMHRLASNPDSVVLRGRWEATRGQ